LWGQKASGKQTLMWVSTDSVVRDNMMKNGEFDAIRTCISHLFPELEIDWPID
jgi:hypothetical protein